MKTNTKWRIGLQILLASSACGATLHVTGCASALVQNFNPCGTILNCNPAEFDLITMDPLKPNYEFNPTCVIPALFNCETSIMTGASETTGTTTTTNTNTGLGT